MNVRKGFIVSEKNNLKIILFFIILTTGLTLSDVSLGNGKSARTPAIDVRNLDQSSIKGLLAELYLRLAAFVVSSEPESYEQELTMERPSGINVPVSASFSTLTTGKERLVILIVRDLSERRRLEVEKAEMQCI